VIVPVRRKAVSAERHCAAERPIGFSRKSGTPACAANSSTGPRANGGVQTKAASTSSQRTVAASVTASQSGCSLASAEARATSTSHATRMRWPNCDALRACCNPIRPQPTIAMRNESGRLSVLISCPYRLPDLAHPRAGHRRVERQRALDAFRSRGFDGLDQSALVSGPPLEPRRQVSRWFGPDDVHAKAPDADRDFPDEAVVAQAVHDHPAAVIREDRGDHRNDRAVVPGEIAHGQAGRWSGPLLELPRNRRLELLQEVSPTFRGRLAGERREEILSPMLQRKDEAAVIEPRVIPLDVRERHPQKSAGLDDGRRRQLAEPDAPGGRPCPDHHARRDAQRIREIEHPRIGAQTSELDGELADSGNDAQRAGQSARTQRFIRRKLEPAGEVLVARPARKAAEADLVHDDGRAVDGLVEPAARRDAPAERGQPAIAVACHSLEGIDVLAEEAQLAGGNAGRRGAKRLHQRGREGRTPAEDGDDRLHPTATFWKK